MRVDRRDMAITSRVHSRERRTAGNWKEAE